jgi:hypothetical protein
MLQMGTQGTVRKENQELSNKIISGFKMAYEKLVKEEAVFGRSLVFGKNKQPVYIPAVELLKEIEKRKRFLYKFKLVSCVLCGFFLLINICQLIINN